VHLFKDTAIIGEMLDHVVESHQGKGATEGGSGGIANHQRRSCALPGEAQARVMDIHTDNVTASAGLLKDLEHGAGSTTDLQHEEPVHEPIGESSRQLTDQLIASPEPGMPMFHGKEMLEMGRVVERIRRRDRSSLPGALVALNAFS